MVAEVDLTVLDGATARVIDDDVEKVATYRTALGGLDKSTGLDVNESALETRTVFLRARQILAVGGMFQSPGQRFEVRAAVRKVRAAPHLSHFVLMVKD